MVFTVSKQQSRVPAAGDAAAAPALPGTSQVEVAQPIDDAQSPDVNTLHLREIKLNARAAESWDHTTAAASASFQATYSHMRAQALKRIGRGKMRAFEFWLADGADSKKVGQCAVMVQGTHFAVQEGLQLLPEAVPHWTSAMRAMLEVLGPGTYSYGGRWSVEPRRDEQLGQIDGVKLQDVRPFVVQGVNFSDWPSWDRYWAKVSDSVRYEAKHAPDRIPGLHLRRHYGMATLKAIWPTIKLQRISYGRKGLVYSRLRHILHYAYNIAQWGRSLELTLAVSDAGILAAYYASRVGTNTYYIFGGQVAGKSGANWYMLKEMLREAYEAGENSRFIMGFVDYSIHDETVGGGLLRSRRALRVKDFETAMIDFEYAAP